VDQDQDLACASTPRCATVALSSIVKRLHAQCRRYYHDSDSAVHT
jgi:hypothetical protein